jgi:CubicO group peptidase (beta-lactamase class C family)
MRVNRSHTVPVCASVVGSLVLPLCLWCQEEKAVFPRANWERVTRPEDCGYSSAKLEALRRWLKTLQTKGLHVSVGGRTLFEYGDVSYVSKIASTRKSVLGMLYGKYVASGQVDLQKTVKEMGLDDRKPFLPIEESATLEMMLMARSGVYQFNGETEPALKPPPNGAQYPGSFFCYQNWDFDAAGTAFEKLTGKNIYDALDADLAKPLGMQDFNRARQRKVPPENAASVHQEYVMYLSTRDMARLGLLMLREGEWDGKRLLSKSWIKYLTTLTTPVHDLYPSAFRIVMMTGPARWGYGVTWWVWDQPHSLGVIDMGPFDGTYMALGTGGQYLTVLPALDMVVSHKVEIEGDKPGDVSLFDYSTILQLLIGAHCSGPCR